MSEKEKSILEQLVDLVVPDANAPHGKLKKKPYNALDKDEDLLLFYQGTPLEEVDPNDRERLKKARTQSRTPQSLLGFSAATRGLPSANQLLGNKLRQRRNVRRQNLKSKNPMQSKTDIGAISDRAVRRIEREKESKQGNTKEESSWLTSPGLGFGVGVGQGLAALGDALVGAGGGRSSYLKGTLDTVQKARQEPYNRLKEFQKMLQTEIDKDRLEEERKWKRKIEERQFGLDQQKNITKIPGTRQAKAMWESFQRHPNKHIREYYKAMGPKYGDAVSVDYLASFEDGYIHKTNKKGYKKTISDKGADTFFDQGGYKDYAMPMFKAKYGKNADTVLSNLTSNEKTKLMKRIDDYKKTIVTTHDWKKNEKQIVERLQLAGRNILKAIMKGSGITNASWDNFETKGNDIYFVNPYTRERTKIDPSGFQIPGLMGRFNTGDFLKAIDPRTGTFKEEAAAGEIGQSIASLLAPLRKRDFGASQSAEEIKAFMREIGQDVMGTEAGLFRFIKNVVLGTGNAIRKRNLRIKDVPIGEMWLKKTGAYTYEDFGGPVSINRRRLHNNLYNKLKKHKEEGKKVRDFRSDDLDTFKVNVTRALRKEKKLLYQYRNAKGVFLGPNRVARGKKGFNASKHEFPMDRWGPSLWLRFLNRMPNDINVYDPSSVEKSLDNFFKRKR